MTKTPPVDAFAQARPIDLPFLLLNAVFLAALLVGQLGEARMVAIDLGFRTFAVSASLMPYAVTLLVGNVVAEVYGRRRANLVVLAGLFASVCAFGAVWLRERFPTAAGSPVGDPHGSLVAMKTWRTVLASLAYLAVQYANVGAFHLLRRATGGRHLWLRSAVAPIVAQLVGAVLLVGVMHLAFRGPVDDLVADVTDPLCIGTLLACASTPFCYAAVLLLQRWRARPL